MLRLNFTEGDVPSLLPADLQGHIRGRTLGLLLYEGLVTKGPDGSIQLAGAESVEVSKDGKEYIFSIRKHFWTNGSAVTAFDYEHAWLSYLDSHSDASHLIYLIKNARLAKEGKILKDEVGIKALDAKKLLVTLEYPNPHFLEILTQPLFTPYKKNKDGSLCFNGPFTLKKWEKGESLDLEKNFLFWNASKIFLNAIHLSFVHDFATAFLMYEKKEIDWIGNPFCRLTVDDMLSLQHRGELSQKVTNRPLWIYFNTEIFPFTSTKMRLAFSQALDRHFLTKHILLEDHPLLTPLPIKLTLLRPQLEHEPEQAKINFEQGLRDLGFAKGKLPPLELCYQDSHKNLCLMLKEIWEKTFGIQIVLKGMEWNVLKTNLEQGNFLMASCTESSIFPDPIELLERFESMNTNNLCRWLNGDYQKNIDLARHAVDQKLRNEYLKKAEEILLDEMPFIPLSNRNHAFAYPQELQQVYVDASGYVDFRWAFWQ